MSFNSLWWLHYSTGLETGRSLGAGALHCSITRIKCATDWESQFSLCCHALPHIWNILKYFFLKSVSSIRTETLQVIYQKLYKSLHVFHLTLLLLLTSTLQQLFILLFQFLVIQSSYYWEGEKKATRGLARWAVQCTFQKLVCESSCWRWSPSPVVLTV